MQSFTAYAVARIAEPMSVVRAPDDVPAFLAAHAHIPSSRIRGTEVGSRTASECVIHRRRVSSRPAAGRCSTASGERACSHGSSLTGMGSADRSFPGESRNPSGSIRDTAVFHNLD